MAEKKEKRYISDNAQLMAEWNWEKNDKLEFYPQMLTVGSERKAWWKCQKGHEWQASIANREKGNGCPYCAGKRVLRGYNDLQTINPILAREWDHEKNNNLKPEEVTANSGKVVWWKCKKGHEWQASIDVRSRGHGCPYCSGRKTIIGENDLQTVNPILANEWNYERNGYLKPEDFKSSSGKKVWWKCQKGHEWQASVNHRAKGRGCPTCASGKRTSFPEYALAYYLMKHGFVIIHSYKEKGYELDIYIPSKQIAIEYDGYLWHRGKIDKDLEKNYKCEKDGITLYRVREGIPPLNDSSIDYIVQRGQKDLSSVLQALLSDVVGCIVDVDLERDTIAIEALREHTEKGNSLLHCNPKVAKEWNYEKNGSLRPENIPANSNKKVWWKCDKGHTWQASISARNQKHGCPYCSGRYAIAGENDLDTINPFLAKEWDYEKNGMSTPKNFTANSGKKVWWKCDKEHVWQATIASRNNGTGCPYCSGNKVLSGYNDLETINPRLAREWSYEQNDGLTPRDVMPNSDKKVWWECNEGHRWQSTIRHRNKGRGCPQCAKEKRKKAK